MSFFERMTEDTSENQITLTAIKQWLKIEHNLDDSLLENLREVAVNEAYNFTQEPFEYKNEVGELVEKPIPFNITMACLMFTAYLYENRGDNPTTIPLNCMKLLTPYKRIVGT